MQWRLSSRGKPDLEYSGWPVAPPGTVDSFRLPALQILGERRFDLLSRVIDTNLLDWELRACNPPFNNLDELLAHVGLPGTRGMGDATRLETIATPPAVLDVNRSRLAQGTMDLAVMVSPYVRPEDVSVAFRAFGSTWQATASGMIASLPEDRSSSEVFYFSTSIGDSHLARVFLSCGSVAIQQYWIEDPVRRMNPRLSAIEVFDAKLEALTAALLEPHPSRSIEFENAVAVVLDLLGFSSVHLGGLSKVREGPDLLVASPLAK
jgi:hypothetical protein